MVNKAEQFAQIIEAIERDFGPLRLFTVLKLEKSDPGWSMYISADWMEQKTVKEREALFSKVFDLVSEHLGPEAKSISRILLLNIEEPFVQQILSILPANPRTAYLTISSPEGDILGVALKVKGAKNWI